MGSLEIKIEIDMPNIQTKTEKPQEITIHKSTAVITPVHHVDGVIIAMKLLILVLIISLLLIATILIATDTDKVIGIVLIAVGAVVSCILFTLE